MGMTTNLTNTNRRPRSEPSAPGEAIALKKKKEFTKFRKDKILKGVLLFNALSAIGGGIGLITGTLPVPTMLLRHTPFDSFVIPGLFLGIIIGGSSLAAAIALRAQATRSRAISSAAGVIMVGWIAAETILVRGFSWLQGLYLLTGIAVVVLSRYLPTPTHPAEPEPVPAVTPKALPGHGLARFFMGTFALSWLVWIPAAFTGQKAMEFPTVLLYALGGFAPTIIGLRMLYRTAPVDLRRSFWHRLVDFKAIRPGWYAMIVLIFPVITGLGMLINTLLGGEQPGMMQWKQIAADPPMLVVSLLMSLVTTLFLGPLSEELGWRGFALDRMITRWGFFRAALLLGLVWGAWHLPLFFIPGTTHYIWGFGSAFFWLFLATMVPLSLLVALAYQQNSRSILAAVLTHMMYNYVISMVFPVPLQLQILITVLLYLVTAGLVWRYVRKVPLAVLAPTLQA
jgi:membrane protease YdiL (CAAX protease family)